MLMFGREPHAFLFDFPLTFDPGLYQHYLQAKLAELQDLVESNLVKAADHLVVCITAMLSHSTRR